MKRKVFLVLTLVLMFGLILYKGAERKALIRALEESGYVKCADGIYRMREFQQEGNYLIMIDRHFDIQKNCGESHITKLFKRVDGVMVKDSFVESLATWDVQERQFDPVDYLETN